MSEGMPEGVQVKEFRADPGSDPVEKAPEFRGIKSAEEVDEAMTDRFDAVMAKLDENPEDPEAVREARVLVERYDELARRLRAKVPE